VGATASIIGRTERPAFVSAKYLQGNSDNFMVNSSNGSRVFCIGIALAVVIGTTALSIVCAKAYAQSTDDELKKAQIEYYKEQTGKLRQKSLMDSIVENPASVMTVLGAVIAALVAVAALVVNSRVTIRTQRDTQFYEALKRFGDKDSAVLRSSAAGLLAQMAGGKKIQVKKRRYFETAIDQLVMGLLLEEDSVALISITNGITYLTPFNRMRIAEKLLVANRKLNADLGDKLGEWYVNSQIKRLEDLSEEKAARLDAVSVTAASMVRYWVQGLNAPDPSKKNKFAREFSTYLEGSKATKREEGGDHLISIQRDLLRITERLADVNRLAVQALIQGTSKRVFYMLFKNLAFFRNLSIRNPMRKKTNLDGYSLPGIDLSNKQVSGVDLFAASLKKARFGYSELTNVGLQYAGLEEADFGGASLRKVKLRGAHLKNANFSVSELNQVDFEEADLQGADFSNATFRKVRFAKTQFDEVTLKGLQRTRWWRIDFGHYLNRDILEALVSLYGKELPTNADSIHESVRSYLEDQEKSDSSESVT
jgi:uncharacterized protein YjbI with pentapeptide repeats